MKKFVLPLAALAALAAGPAHADPVSAIASVFTAIGVGAATATALASMVVGLGSQLLATAFMTKQKGPEVNVKFQTEFGDDKPLSFVVGKYATPGKRKYVGSWGKDTRFITEVIEISAVPITGIVAMWVDDEQAEIDWATNAVGGVSGGVFGGEGSGYLLGHPVKNYTEDRGESDERDRVWIRLVDGTQTAADPMLMAVFGDDENYPWTSAMIGTGKAYLIATYYYDPEVMTRAPSLLIEPSPLPLYDPRKDVTVGGVGAHRWGQSATYEATKNPAVIAYNIARGIYYGNEWLFGGKNLAAWRLPLAEWVAAMNACDQAVPVAGGATEQYARCGAEISVDMDARNVLREIGRAANMRFASCGGTLKPIVGLPGASVYTITDDDIVITQGQSFRPFAPMSETFNAITASYPEPREKWASKPTKEYKDADLTAADGGRYLPTSVTFGAAPYARQVQRLMRAQLRDYRRARTHQITLPPDAFALEPLVDAITWTSARNGYAAKKFIVEGITKMPGMCSVVSLREVDPSDYDWSSDWEVPTTITTPRNPVPATQVITGFDAEPFTVVDEASQARRPAIRVSCDGDDVGATAIRIQVYLSGQTEPEIDVTRPYGEPYRWIIQPVLPLTTYLVRARVVSEISPRSAWTSYVVVTTPNVRLTGADLDPVSIEEAIADRLAELDAAADAAAQEAQDAAAAAAGVRADHDNLVAGFTGTLSTAFSALDAELLGITNNLTTVTSNLNAVYDSATGQVKATALTGYYTKAQSDSAISAQVSSLESEILSGGQVRATLLTAYYTKTATDSAISAAKTELSARINANGLPSDFAEDGAKWSQAISGAAAGKADLGSPVTFVTDGPMGRVARVPGSITANCHIAPKGYLPNVAGKTYRATIKARHNSAFTGDSANALLYVVRKFDKDFASVSDLNTFTLTFPTANSIRTFQVEWTSDGASGAPYILPFAYVSGTRTSASMSIDIQSIEVVDISGSAEVAANLSTNYYTKAQTDGAISAVQTTLTGQINTGNSNLQGQINSILGLTISPTSALAVTLTDLVADVGVAQSSITAQGSAIADLEGNASAGYLIRAQAGGSVSLLDLVAADGSAGSVSVAKISASQILLDGSVSAQQIVVTDFSGNLVLNGAMPYGDTRGWAGMPSSFLVIPKSSSPAVLASSPTAYVLRMFPDAALQAVTVARFDCKPGQRFTSEFDAAAANQGSGINLTAGLRFLWYDASGAFISQTARAVTITAAPWATRTGAIAVAPTGAAYATVQAYRAGGDVGAVYITNMEVLRQRSGSLLITPQSITGAELIATEAVITQEAQIGALTVGSAAIRELAVDTIHVAGDAITTLDVVNFATVTVSASSYVAIAGLSKSIAVGDKITIIARCGMPNRLTSQSANRTRLRIDGATLAASEVYSERLDNPEGTFTPYVQAYAFIATSTSVQVQMQGVGGGDWVGVSISIFRSKK